MLNTTKLTTCALVLGAIAACGARPTTVAPGEEAGQSAAKPTGANLANEQLPINQRFRNLDEYLAFLERTQGPVDGPWYRQVRPGVYQMQTGGNLRLDGGNPPPQTFTREELERKFGFRN